MARRKGSGGTRHVVQLSDENTLALRAACIPPGASEPPFGAQSKLINLILDDWRARRALASTSSQQSEN